MKRQSITVNFIFQIIYQVVILVLPLIMTPMLTRRLGGTALGIYSYVHSIAHYFVIFANLGISRYGQRVIAAAKNNVIELRRAFWSLFITHIIISTIAIYVYMVVLILCPMEDSNIFWLFIVYIWTALFDLTWLFYGLENFKNVVVNNLIIRIIVFALVFFLVKTPSDLWVYTLIELLSGLLGNIVLLIIALKKLPFIRVTIKECIVHIKPLLVLSISVIAVSLYTVFDKTLLGIMTTKENVAYYEYSNKIINIPKTFIGVVGTVLFPRACEMANKEDYRGQRYYADISCLVVFFIGFASVFGLSAIAEPFAIEYFGESFKICGKIIISLSPLILVIGITDLLRSIYLIPLKKDGVYVVFTCLCSLTNLIVSIALIPSIGIFGAVIGTFCAEVLLCLLYVFYLKKYIDFKIYIKAFSMFFVSGIFMWTSINIVNRFVNFPTKQLLVFDVFFGGVIYVFFSGILLYVFLREYWNLLISQFKRLRNSSKKI